jgi:hypothetical protein
MIGTYPPRLNRSGTPPRHPTFLRHRHGHDADQSKRAVPSMTASSSERSLTSLVQGVGLDYLRRLLPPPWLALALLATTTTWMALSTHDLIAICACAIALGGLLVHWPQRGKRAWPLWRTCALGLAAAMEAVPGWAHQDLLRAVLLLIATASTLQLLARLVAAVRLSLRLQRSAQAMDDASLLAMLPDEAREDARRWRGGDDSKSAELQLVVNLAALWAALSAVNAADARAKPRPM